jgi:hypothetical protein
MLRIPPERRLLLSFLAAGAALLAVSCGGEGPTESSNTQLPIANSPLPGNPITSFALGEAGNGPGQCLSQDAVDAGFLQNLEVGDLNCTSNDVDISFAEVTFFSINDPDPVGGFTPLPAGEEIDCVPGDVIYAVTGAKIQNSAQERYDFGLWINPTDGGSAYDGPDGQCLHFNLVVGDPGVSDLDLTSDACGDIAGSTLVTVPLDTLVLQCPAGGATTVTVDACAAWSNSTTGSADRVCPVPGVSPESDGYRQGTTPGTVAKCRCEPLDLPINVKGVIRVDKVTDPSGDDQSFAFAATGEGFATPFNLTDASTPHSSGPIDEGTYGITETVPAGWALTGRNCVITGTDDPADFSNSGANGVSVELGSGQDITCTFTNTKLASVTIKKVTDPAEDPAVGSFSFSQDFDATGNFNLGHNGTKVFSNIVPGVEKTVVESDPAPYGLTDITCTGAATWSGTEGTRTLEVTPAPGETIVCTFTNTAASLDVTKDATPTFTRSWTWNVAKVADPTTIELDPGQVYNHPYSVTASVAGTSDGDWAVTGNIAVENTSPFSVSIASVTDAIAGIGAVDNVTCGVTFPHVLASGATLNCTYSEDDFPDGTSRLNTASVTITGIATPFTGTANVVFGTPTTLEDNCLVVKDEGDLGDTDPLGTVCVAGTHPPPDGAFDAPKTFNYTRLVPTGEAQCGLFTYDNTATGTTNTTSTVVTASASIDVTIECPEGCTLTQGYWKTHNPSFAAARNGNGPPPDETWEELPDGEQSGFFTTGLNSYPAAGPNPPSFTWFNVFWTAPKGNAYYNLAHQYMAAKLNILDNVTPTQDVADAIADAEALFAVWTPAAVGALKGNNATRAEFIELAGILGAFNEGLLGTEHCTEDASSAL